MNKKGFILPLAIMAGAAVIIALFAYFTLTANEQEEKTKLKNANTNTSLNANASADEAAGWETYTNSDLKISFKFPEAWGPVKASNPFSAENGKNVRVDFEGSDTNSFGSNFQLNYNTEDFTVGTEIWLGQAIGRFAKNKGIKNICNHLENIEPEDKPDWYDNLSPAGRVGYAYYGLNEISNCQVREVNGLWQAEFLARIDALGGEEVLDFLKIFVFETENEEFPAALLAVFLPELNKVTWHEVDYYPEGGYWEGISTTDTAAIEEVYSKIENMTADTETNQLVSIFNNIVSTFRFTE